MVSIVVQTTIHGTNTINITIFLSHIAHVRSDQITEKTPLDTVVAKRAVLT